MFEVVGTSLKPGPLLRGHAGRVRAIAWLPGGPGAAALLTGADDQTLRAWHLAGGAHSVQEAAGGSPPASAEQPGAGSAGQPPRQQQDAPAPCGQCAGAVAGTAHPAPARQGAAGSAPGDAGSARKAHAGAGDVASAPAGAAAESRAEVSDTASAAASAAPRRAARGSRQSFGTQPLAPRDGGQVGVLAHAPACASARACAIPQDNQVRAPACAGCSERHVVWHAGRVGDSARHGGCGCRRCRRRCAACQLYRTCVLVCGHCHCCSGPRGTDVHKSIVVGCAWPCELTVVCTRVLERKQVRCCSTSCRCCTWTWRQVQPAAAGRAAGPPSAGSRG